MNEIDLCGAWRILPDAEDRGLRERWFERPPEVGWLPITVPSAWQHTLGEKFHGVAWYRKRVKPGRNWHQDGSRLWLRFEAVATDCRVWVNGMEIGRHVGDYLPFQFEVPANAIEGKVLDVVVRVDEIAGGRPAPGSTIESGHITKGFHDVLSLQHGGIWDRVTLRQTGRMCAIPNGASMRFDERRGVVLLSVELEPGHDGGDIQVDILRDGRKVEFSASGVGRQSPTADAMIEEFDYPEARWSADQPTAWRARIQLGDMRGASDVVDTPFFVRTVSTGGPDHRTILLNGQPLCIRGVLHWGIEPRHISPAPRPAQVRAEFARLLEMGFNCVCLCMWYPPEYFYDIADEMGMLIWQEHPAWKSPMGSELLPEYQRLFDGFFRRDRRHPSVVIVSGSCEHERIHPDLAAWWWKRAKQELPDRLVQVQTAFIGWTNPAQTDLHDEHVYESSGRWVKFLEDVQATLKELPPKPFVMGETVIGTSWVDTAAYPAQGGPPSSTQHSAPSTQHSPWWVPNGLPECRELEKQVVERYGTGTLDRFKRHADRSNLLHRKFQSEAFRSFHGNAGWVMNQLRDVTVGRLGFMDEFDRWRFAPEQTRPWLCDCPILLKTPDRRSGFFGARYAQPATLPVEVGLSNFAPATFDGPLRLGAGDGPTMGAALRCETGQVVFTGASIALPQVEQPVRLPVRAEGDGLVANSWDLWVFPAVGDVPPDVVRLDGIPFDAPDHELDFEERCYSSGWGLKVRSWKPVLPHPETVLFKAPLWRFDAPMPPGTRLVVTHKMTRGLVEFMEGGGRVLWLAAGRTRGSLPTKFVTLWGQCPLVPEEGVLGPGDSEWAVDLLHHDLTRRYTRAIPSEELGLAAHVDPVIRLVFTHDRGIPKLFDAAFATRVGRGLLLASSLDHTEDAGQYLLRRMVDFGLQDRPAARGELQATQLQAWAI